MSSNISPKRKRESPTNSPKRQRQQSEKKGYSFNKKADITNESDLSCLIDEFDIYIVESNKAVLKREECLTTITSMIEMYPTVFTRDHILLHKPKNGDPTGISDYFSPLGHSSGKLRQWLISHYQFTLEDVKTASPAKTVNVTERIRSIELFLEQLSKVWSPNHEIFKHTSQQLYESYTDNSCPCEVGILLYSMRHPVETWVGKQVRVWNMAKYVTASPEQQKIQIFYTCPCCMDQWLAPHNKEDGTKYAESKSLLCMKCYQ